MTLPRASINRVTGRVERDAPPRPAFAVEDATGLSAGEVHARLTAGVALRMTARQYVAVAENAALTPRQREDIRAFRRKNDIRLVGA